MMNQVYKTLPDDRPITSICIVGSPEHCPKGYLAVSRTHDQDADADLWRDSGFFGRKCSRYLCLSKTEGVTDYVLQSVVLINEKEAPPKGYEALSSTHDSAQRALKKKQLCVKYAHYTNTSTAVTDIIVLSRMKQAPEEFTLSGEVNGLTLCYKLGKSVAENGMALNQTPRIPYCVNPGNQGYGNAKSNSNYQKELPNMSPYNSPENGVKKPPHGRSNHLLPHRPAPKPPTSYATISGFVGAFDLCTAYRLQTDISRRLMKHNDFQADAQIVLIERLRELRELLEPWPVLRSLEGVPFILNPKWSFSNTNSQTYLPKPKTRIEIDSEYKYEFRAERET